MTLDPLDPLVKTILLKLQFEKVEKLGRKLSGKNLNGNSYLYERLRELLVNFPTFDCLSNQRRKGNLGKNFELNIIVADIFSVF